MRAPSRSANTRAINGSHPIARPNYKGLVSLYESAHKQYGAKDGTLTAERTVREAVAAKDFDLQSFDFGAFFGEVFGWNDFHHCRSTGKLAWEVMEAAGPTMTTAFQSISGQVIYGLIMEPYQSPEFNFTKLIPTRKTEFQFEKIPGISDIGDEVSNVNEGDEFPSVSVTASYRNAPELRKRGFKTSMTREALFFDRTGMLQQKLAGGGKSMGQNREKRAVDCVIDENGGAVSAVAGGHRYHYRGNSIASYGNSSGNHDWDNLQGSNGIVDWTDVEAAAILLYNMTDPDTAEPIVFQPKHVVVAQANELTALRIRNATEIRVVTPGYATSGNPTHTSVGNPYGGKFDVVTSPYVASRLATDTDWFYGDLPTAVEYCQAWPEEVKTLAGGTQLEFDRDIVQQYRFSEFGNYSWKQPRAVVKSTVGA